MNPLVIILEGPNGSGKTTLARMLSEECGGTRYRVFEESKIGTPKAVELAVALKAAGVPLNTHIDDLYAADAIRRLCSDDDVIILDRSFPSGLAYARAGIDRVGTVSGNSPAVYSADQRARDATHIEVSNWMKIWFSMFPRRLYVTLNVSYNTGRARTAERTRWYPTPEQHEVLLAQFFWLHSIAPGPSLMINSDEFDPSEIFKRIKERIPRVG